MRVAKYALGPAAGMDRTDDEMVGLSIITVFQHRRGATAAGRPIDRAGRQQMRAALQQPNLGSEDLLPRAETVEIREFQPLRHAELKLHFLAVGDARILHLGADREDASRLDVGGDDLIEPFGRGERGRPTDEPAQRPADESRGAMARPPR